MRARFFALFLTVGLLTEGSAFAAPVGRHAGETGISTSSISLGGIIDQTGRGTVISTHILAGYQLAIAELNAHGGVNGRKVSYTALNDNYDPSQTLPLAKQLVESSGVFAIMGVFGSDDVKSVASYIEGQHVPFFDPIGGGVNISGKKWIWQTEPDYGREGKVIARYVATTLHAKRVAILYQAGIGESQRDALKNTLPKFGASLVANRSYAATDNSLSGQVLALRSANPDIIVLNGTPTPTELFVQDARLLGYKPKDGYIANYPMGDPLWAALLQGAAEGTRVSSYADLTGKNSVAAAYRNAISTYHAEAYSNYGLYGYFNATLFFKALKDAGKNPTRASLQKALDTKFRSYDTKFAGILTWTPTQRYGARQFKIYQIRSGQFIPVTGWLKP
jgi:branched-chain amino acid transport system substrate-binding protein